MGEGSTIAVLLKAAMAVSKASVTARFSVCSEFWFFKVLDWLQGLAN